MTNEMAGLVEEDLDPNSPDPDETPIRDRKVVTQPYDLVVDALMEQINAKTLHLRPISDRPRFQRHYIWPDKLASRLIESILLNVPIPPCYLSQNEEFELDVIDGQQRIYSIYRFVQNEFALSDLEIMTELNGRRFFEIPIKEKRKTQTHTLRCVVITNDSHPEVKFDVFERLNTNTVPLNSQELRNCIFRGPLNDLLGELSNFGPWLQILGRKTPDKRLRDEELILRFFAFQIFGVERYRTPLKHWLNDAAKAGRKLNSEQLVDLKNTWIKSINNALSIFPPHECFRRSATSGKRRQVPNRALMDLVLMTLAKVSEQDAIAKAEEFRHLYYQILENADFNDLISKSVDHKSRTVQRFEMWNKEVAGRL